MKSKYIFIFLLTLTNILPLFSQENIYPAPVNKSTIAITGATIHIGNGSVINNGTVVINDSKIQAVGNTVKAPTGAKIILATGKHVYPGIIAMNTNLGLAEISSIRAESDHTEIGDINTSIKSISAYDAQSSVIPTVRSNGVLLAHVVPRGATISGTSSIVQLDAWDWRDAGYKVNNGIHFNMPSLVNRPRGFAAFLNPNQPNAQDVIKTALNKIDEVRKFLREAKAYASLTNAPFNLKYDAVKGLFNKSQKLFVHCDLVKEMIMAIDIKKEFGLDIVLVGGADSYLIPELLKENNVPVILNEPHSLPSIADDAVDQPYKTGAQLAKAGVLFSIMIENDHWQQRCIPFQAGTMAAYGLAKEDAVKAITLDAAKILGIDSMTGSIEEGKDANIVISEGDILDMKSSKVSHAFIQGRQISLDNKHTQLFEKYKYKYGIK